MLLWSPKIGLKSLFDFNNCVCHIIRSKLTGYIYTLSLQVTISQIWHHNENYDRIKISICRWVFGCDLNFHVQCDLCEMQKSLSLITWFKIFLLWILIFLNFVKNFKFEKIVKTFKNILTSSLSHPQHNFRYFNNIQNEKLNDRFEKVRQLRQQHKVVVISLSFRFFLSSVSLR